MGRPREFDEQAVLDAAVQSFWKRGYEATSIRDLVKSTGLTGASLYNAFGDKQSIYRRALDHYVEGSIGERIRRCEAMEPRAAIEAFFRDILARSIQDEECKGCMLVNAALDVAPEDPGFRAAVAAVLQRLEDFFLSCVSKGQEKGTITLAWPAEDLARHLLGVLMGVRVLARVKPDRALLEGIVETALALVERNPIDSRDRRPGPGGRPG
ncbi:MAG: TetR/AcrR family transcriptional regulator [Bosea sp.]|nr:MULTISPECIES: TetR/AcrR family transcriptional regulator [unclassified Bosea (in: a-proteobacteria)]MBN9458161.1 TetR/AcrR family transcriptional regulator [Bosea sp. (in: a-proteobacteria)]OJV07086.1 MAG: TetR family transcriptional regulator [Bosea sp. 67-29]